MASSGNFSTMNPLSFDNATFSKGNLLVNTDGNYADANSTFVMTSGKWYIEARNDGAGLGNFERVIGIRKTGSTLGTVPWSDSNKYVWFAPSGNIRNNSNVSYGSSWTADGDIIGIALDLDNNALWFSKNNTWQNSATKSEIENGTTTNAAFTGLTNENGYTLLISSGDTAGRSTGALMYVNFGQDSTFAGDETAGGNADSNGFGDFKYAPPSGFLALCSANLPISDDIDPSQTNDNYPQKQFDAEAFTGNAGTQTIQLGDSFKPDCVWLKNRGTANSWIALDSSRGYNKTLKLETQDAESTNAYVGYGIESDFFDSTGIKANSGGSAGFNGSGGNYIVYGWRANGGTTTSDSSGDITVNRQSNTSGGFAILTYTGNGSDNQTIAHGLGKTPALVITKNLSSSSHWAVWHHQHTGYYGQLESYGAWASDSNQFYTSGMTSNFIGVRTAGATNSNGHNMLAYVWTEISGYSSIGKYEGNANSDGTFVFTGGRPVFLWVKDVDRGEYYQAFDSARNTFNPVDKGLSFASNGAESTGSGSGFDVDFLSNGFKMRCTHDNLNGSSTYVYACFMDIPFKYNNTF